MFNFFLSNRFSNKQIEKVLFNNIDRFEISFKSEIPCSVIAKKYYWPLLGGGVVFL